MATYKVLQDIEAEDKLLGPLTLKQFIFAAITAVLIFVEFRLALAGALGPIRWLFVLIFLIPTIIFGFLAAPFSRDQPNEVWLLARLRFMLKPHRRIWDQSGALDLVTITAPKREIHQYTNNLTQTEVRSRLSALANTLDSRGWAVKNVAVNLFTQPGYLTTQDDSDRLVNPSTLPQDVPNVTVSAADDIMDERSNPVAQHLDQMMQASTQAHKAQLIQSMQHPAPAPAANTQDGQPADYWFLNNPSPQAGQQPAQAGLATFQNTPVVHPGEAGSAAPQPTAEEIALVKQADGGPGKPAPWISHMKTIMPLGKKDKAAKGKKAEPKTPPPVDWAAGVQPPPPAAPPVAATTDPGQNTGAQGQTTPSNPAILNLANNDDLNVATIARQAKKIQSAENGDEVVISLH